MSLPVRVKIKCPGCGEWFETGYWASINLMVEPLSEEDVEERITHQCSHCGKKIVLPPDLLVTSEEWLIFEADREQEKIEIEFLD
uniref:CpXC domain-containing protein n=1 Tax=Archaeoglobus fulgidus TaxID=2234 RepID=A0A7J3M0T3_ARCFL